VRIVRKGHALEGQELPVLRRCKRGGQLHLLLILPGESRSYIPAGWTDLQLRTGAAVDDSAPAAPALLATIKDLFNARIVIDALLGRMADAQEIDDATRTGPAGSTSRSGVVDGRGMYCLIVGGVQIDAAVAQAFLAAIAPAGLSAAVRAAEQLQADHDGALAQWRLAVQRAQYESEKAQRRYRAVDPDNRLVARGLETHWEQCLRALEQARTELAQREQQRPHALTDEERRRLLRMSEDLSRVWHAA